jgi:hypothetical protein
MPGACRARAVREAFLAALASLVLAVLEALEALAESE